MILKIRMDHMFGLWINHTHKHTPLCDECLFEIWERITFGGAKIEGKDL